jgi:hypothetical protein
VQRVYRITLPPAIKEGFHAYKTHVQEERVRSGRDDGGVNMQHLYHGTSQHADCHFASGTGSNCKYRPCARPDCAVCSICTHGFKLRYAGTGSLTTGAFAKLRFGKGLYYSSCSGKSHDYAAMSQKPWQNNPTSFRSRLMFRAGEAMSACSEQVRL